MTPRWRFRTLAVLLAGGSLLGGCSLFPEDFNREPPMSPVATPSQPVTVHEPPLRQKVSARTTSSAWSDRSADLFRDARAIKPGDILTVKISINDKAEFDSTANRSRDAQLSNAGSFDLGLSGLFVNKNANGSVALSNETKTSSQASGTVGRSETMVLSIAATVVEILPNGNLVIQGMQEMRVNYEKRVLTVQGIVRARDIATDNSVAYDKIAEARVSYGGQGRTMEILQPPPGQQLYDRVMPF